MHFEWPRMSFFGIWNVEFVALFFSTTYSRGTEAFQEENFFTQKCHCWVKRKNIIIEQYKGRKPFGVFFLQGNTFYNQKEFYSYIFFSGFLIPIYDFLRKSRTSLFKTNDCVCDKTKNVIIASLINEMTLI